MEYATNLIDFLREFKMDNSGFRNFIWDVEGTLFDTAPAYTYALSKALGDLRIPLPMDRIDHLVRRSASDCVKALAHETNMDSEVLHIHFSSIYTNISPKNQPVFPGVVTILEAVVAAGGVNVIATHRNFVMTQRLLFTHQIANYFQDIVTLENGFSRKPAPELFNILMVRNGFDPRETLVIGNRDVDVQAAQAAGVQACLFRPNDKRIEANFMIHEYEQLFERIRLAGISKIQYDVNM